MYKVGAVGDFENTAYFGAIGAETFFPKSQEDAAEIIKKLCASDFAVIYVSEKYFNTSRLAAEKYRDKLIPAIVPLPLGEDTGIGKDIMKDYVKRAIGSDIIFND